jgi:excisionase family DNA binding protein
MPRVLDIPVPHVLTRSMPKVDEAAAEPKTIRPALVGMAETAKLLGISRNMAYELIKKDEFPIPVRRIGSLYKVNRAELMAYIEGEHPAASSG